MPSSLQGACFPELDCLCWVHSHGSGPWGSCLAGSLLVCWKEEAFQISFQSLWAQIRTSVRTERAELWRVCVCSKVTVWGRLREGPCWNAVGVWQSKLSQAETLLVAENSNHPSTQNRCF